MNNLKIAFAVVATVLGVLGGVWAMEEHYVPRDYHQLCMQTMTQQMQDFQKTNQIQRAQDQVFYWMRIETQLREDLARNPSNISIQQKVSEARRLRCDAEQRLNDLQR